jgi:CheY-like chemotaxis protein
MTKKVLVAEDSLTVQKVIGFTLENEPFQLVFAENEKILFSNLDQGPFDLVALDMSLSEKKSGYDLVREIKLKYPKVSVLALFGTFDAIDEKALKNSGADERIIKPFDSQEFVSKCKKLTKITEKVLAKEPDIISSTENTLDEWTLDAPEMKTSGKSEDLSSDFASWSVDIPGVIEEPQLLNESLLEDGAKLLDTMNKAQDIENEALVEEKGFDDKNLEFPEMIGKTLSQDYLSAKQLVPEEFAEDETMELFPPSSNLDTVVSDDISAEDFWAIDEGDLDTEVEVKPKKVVEKTVPAYSGDQNLVMELTESLKPFIEEQIRKYCEKMAEKVAWEVIPDLAENLIKREIKEISKTLD